MAADEKKMLVATGGHSIGRKWVQVAADDKRMMAATGGHWRPLEWLQVAASGCQAWVKLYFSPFTLSWAENIGNFPLPAHGKFITFSVGGVLAMTHFYVENASFHFYVEGISFE